MRDVTTKIALLWSCVAVPLAAQANQSPEEKLKRSDSLSIASTRTISFETREGTAMNLDLSPDGKTIVFDLLGDIYTVPIGGGNATRLTSGPAVDAHPVFSPDGARIAFTSDRSGVENIWIMDADGKNPKALTKERTAPVAAAEWLPVAGDFLLIARKSDGYWAYEKDGTGTQLKLRDAGAAWSRDARFVYSVGSYSGISRFDWTTGESEPVSRGPLSLFRPTVSPDGKTVVFGAELDGKLGLRVLNVETEDEQWLVYPLKDRDVASQDPNLMGMPRFTFTPDGAAVIIANGGTFNRIDLGKKTVTPISFVAKVEIQLGDRGTPSLLVDGGPVVVPTIRSAQRDRSGALTVFVAHRKIWTLWGGGPAQPLADQSAMQRDPALSPDGKTVVYATWDGAHGGHLWKVPVTGGVPQQLTRQSGVYRNPVWSPDGASIAFGKEEESTAQSMPTTEAEIHLMPANGGASRRITDARADDRVSFSADGRALIVVLRPEPAQPSFGGFGMFGGFSQQQQQQPRITAPTLIDIQIDDGDVDTLAKLPANAEQIAVSPDVKWVAYTAGRETYVAKIRLQPGFAAAGGANPGISTPKAIDRNGADGIRWEPDGQTLTWTRGNQLFRIDAIKAATASSGEPGGTPPQPVTPEVVTISVTVPRNVPTGSVALQGATVITMNGDEVLRDATILVTGNRITALGPRSEVRLPPNTRVIDVTGKTIIPGLIDVRGTFPIRRDGMETINGTLAANLAFGVTTVRDLQSGEDGFGYSALVNSGSMLSSRILPGFRADFTKVNSLDSARAFVRRAKEMGATAVKATGRAQRRQRQWLATAAREEGVLIVGESADLDLTLAMIMDGYHTIEGAIPNAQLYDDVKRLLAESKTVYVPSLVSGGGPSAATYFGEYTDVRNDPKLKRFGFTKGGGQWLHIDDYHFIPVGREANRIRELGGTIGAGTAGAGQPGLSLHWEIWGLGRTGWSNHESLRAATAGAAAALGLSNELGTIAVGKLADLVVLDLDPLADLANTKAIRYVMRNGELFDGNTLDMIWPRIQPAPPIRDTDYEPPQIAGKKNETSSSPEPKQ